MRKAQLRSPGQQVSYNNLDLFLIRLFYFSHLVKCLGDIAVASSPTKLVTGAEPTPALDNATSSLCVSIDDIEREASKTISPRAWAYFHSAAASIGTLRNN